MDIWNRIYNYVYRQKTGKKKNTLDGFNIVSNNKLYCAYDISNRDMYNTIRNKPIQLHTYWYGEFGRKQALSIKSAICTQNLSEVEIVLWLDVENGYNGYNKNEFIRQLLPYITIKKYDPLAELVGTKFESVKFLFLEKGHLPYRADGFRMLILNKYGGLYFDLDVMFLRDISDLLSDQEFCYPWEDQAYGNNAILYFRKGSYLNNYLSNKIIKLKCTRPWIIFKFKDIKLSPLKVYPCIYFDPLWQEDHKNTPINTFEEFFVKQSEKFQSYSLDELRRHFFYGSYAYHWHNMWKVKEENGSFFCLFEKQFDLQLMMLGE